MDDRSPGFDYIIIQVEVPTVPREVPHWAPYELARLHPLLKDMPTSVFPQQDQEGWKILASAHGQTWGTVLAAFRRDVRRSGNSGGFTSTFIKALLDADYSVQIDMIKFYKHLWAIAQLPSQVSAAVETPSWALHRIRKAS